MGYISNEDVEIRLVGKVRFTDDRDDENKMPRELLKRLIREAEGQVERDLSPRYAAPFRHETANTWGDLPSTTRETLRTMCELAAVIRVLQTDFGKGTANNGDTYKKQLEKQYDGMVKRELAQRVAEDDAAVMGQWRYPPLESLLTHLVNATDTGMHGVILTTSRGEGDYPAKQITDPSENFFNGVIDD